MGTQSEKSGGAVETTDDGRYVVVDGRRWRATDPHIPEKLRAELVSELMSARRGVKQHEEGSRARLQAAKVALGERGDPWWDQPSEESMRHRMTAAYTALLHHRPTGTVCPSEAARIVGGTDWRQWSGLARDLAWELAERDQVCVLQRGRPVPPGTPGPIRVGHPGGDG